MAHARRSRFIYGDEGDFTTTLPVRAWVPGDRTIGGILFSTGGVPGAFIVRRDPLLNLVLRVEESEWLDVLALVAFGQTGQSLLWFPDVDEAPFFTVFLDLPAAGSQWGPERDGQYLRNFDVPLRLRSHPADARVWEEYFAAPLVS